MLDGDSLVPPVTVVLSQGADGEGGGAEGPGAVLEGETGRAGAGACPEGAPHTETGEHWTGRIKHNKLLGRFLF